MARKHKILAGIAGVLILFLLIVAIVIATFDWNRMKPYIDQKASDALGRPFAINGDLSVHWQREPDEGGWRAWVPWPQVSAQDISIGNTDWGKAPNMATLKQAQFSVSPLGLLAKRLVIRRIQLTEPSADLERLKDGRANWVFTQKEAGQDTGQPSAWTLDINEIGFDKGRVAYRDEILQADLEVLVDPLGKPVPFADLAGAQLAGAQAGAAATKDYVFGWGVKGRYKGMPLSGTGKVGGMLGLQDARNPFPLQADVAFGPTKASIVGTLTNPMNLGALDLRLKLNGASMSDLYPLTGVTLPDTPPYSTDGHLVAQLQNAQGATFQYQGFNGKVGDSDIHGTISYAAGKPRPKLTGKLTSNLLRFADLGPLIGSPTGKSAGGTAAAKAQPSAAAVSAEGKKASVENAKPADQPADKALPVQQFRTERWRDMDADVALDAKRIVQTEDLPLTDLQAHVVLTDGVLTLQPLRFGMAGGSLNADIRLDGAKTPMQGQVKMSVRQLKLKQLFPKVQAMQKSLGELNGDAALSGTGNSIAALMASSNGETKLLVNDGLISRSLMEIAGLNVGNYVVSKLFGDDEVKINCGASDVQFKDGTATPRLFVFDTENALIDIGGTVDFKTEKLDLDITPHSKGLRIISLRSPLYVDGTLKDPKAGVKVLPLAARGAGMVVLGAVLTPVAGLLALIVPSNNAEGNQCSALLQQMQQPSKAPPPKAPPPKAAAPGRAR